MRGSVVALGLLAQVALAGCNPNTVPPEQAAQKLVDDLGLKIVGRPNCTHVDTDNDGYVTCTVNQGDGQLLSLQCAALGAEASGCKKTELKAVRTAP